MKYVRKRKSIVGILTVLMMVLAMVPSMAFATSEVAGYDVSISGSHNVLTGTNPELTANITQPSGTTVHVDWSSSNTNVATISTHNGGITPVAVGDATITATLREGAAPTGSGTGTGGNCTTTILATATFDITVIQSEAYGYQGTGGNTMKMLIPSNITGGTLTPDGYYNIINDKMNLSNNSCTFTFTMGAGVNNFQPTNFINNSLPYISILDTNWNEVNGSTVTVVGDNWFNETTKGITVTANGLAANQTYIIEFGANVCGNNPSKKLGVPVDFQFETE